MAGRKSLKDELEVLRRYEQLAPKVFAYVTKVLDEGNELDKRWAADWLKAAYVKMIPQKLQGDENQPFYIKQIIINKDAGDNGHNQPTSQAI